LCGRGDWRNFKVDHCHRTGLIRGELCSPCNANESRREDPAVVQYRLRPPAVLLGATRLYDRHDPLLYREQVTPPAPQDPYKAAAFLQQISQQDDGSVTRQTIDRTPDWFLGSLDTAWKRFAG